MVFPSEPVRFLQVFNHVIKQTSLFIFYQNLVSTQYFGQITKASMSMFFLPFCEKHFRILTPALYSLLEDWHIIKLNVKKELRYFVQEGWLIVHLLHLFM